MKIRNGFVSNSSSSSFIIRTKYLTLSQINLIQNYVEENANSAEEFRKEHIVFWDVRLSKLAGEDIVEFDTDMDNFDMLEYLEKIGVDITKVEDRVDNYTRGYYYN